MDADATRRISCDDGERVPAGMGKEVGADGGGGRRDKIDGLQWPSYIYILASIEIA